MQSIPVVETFSSVQGEGFHACTEMFFIRLAGCNQKCLYCDTSKDLGHREDLPNLVYKARKSKLQRVCITGGEPCIHNELPILTRMLKDQGFLVHLETNGTLPIPLVDWVTVSPKGKSLHSSAMFAACEWKVIIPWEKHWTTYKPGRAYLYVQPADPNTPLISYLKRIGFNLNLCKPYLEREFQLSLQLHKVFSWR